MVASVDASHDSPVPGSPHHSHKKRKSEPIQTNRVLKTLSEMLGALKTFGENLIFILNRLGGLPELSPDIADAEQTRRRKASASLCSSSKCSTCFSARRRLSSTSTRTTSASSSTSSFVSSLTCQTRAKGCGVAIPLPRTSELKATRTAPAHLSTRPPSTPHQYSATRTSV